MKPTLAASKTASWSLSHPLLQGGGMGAQHTGGQRPEVGPLAWNPRFGKILAMGLSNGICVLWDLGKDKPRPVSTLRNPAG